MPEEKINNIEYKFYKGTTHKTRNAVKNTVAEFQKRAGKNSEFINGFTFSIVNKYKDLNPSNFWEESLKVNSDAYKHILGSTNATVIDAGKWITVQTKEHSFPRNIFHRNISPKYIELATLHEIGHNFDNYYGKKDENIVNQAKKIDYFSILFKESKIIIDKYMKNKDLSDSEEFKQAWVRDAEALGKNKSKYNKFKKNDKILYFAINEIDITDGITSEELENADKSRSEIFAQLFAYALGKDDGNKDEIIKAYPNTYKFVQNCIEKYLQIEL